MKRWKYWDNDKCPCCMTNEERSAYHIFTCNEPEMKAYRQELYKNIKK